jgi:hypothetical protein
LYFWRVGLTRPSYVVLSYRTAGGCAVASLQRPSSPSWFARVSVNAICRLRTDDDPRRSMSDREGRTGAVLLPESAGEEPQSGPPDRAGPPVFVIVFCASVFTSGHVQRATTPPHLGLEVPARPTHESEAQ